VQLRFIKKYDEGTATSSPVSSQSDRDSVTKPGQLQINTDSTTFIDDIRPPLREGSTQDYDVIQDSHSSGFVWQNDPDILKNQNGIAATVPATYPSGALFSDWNALSGRAFDIIITKSSTGPSRITVVFPGGLSEGEINYLIYALSRYGDNLTEEQRAALEKAIVPAGTHLDPRYQMEYRYLDSISARIGVKFLF
jgi:hypothetical protein